MALQHSATHDGLTYPEAYTRISLVHMESKGSAFYTKTYADSTAREREDAPIFVRMYSIAPSQLVGDVYKLAYDHLKTQPGFENATTYPDGDDVKPPAAPEPAPEPTQPEAQE